MPKVSEQHLEAKRRTILLAALACFARDGFHKTKMSDIAEMAGVSDGLAYRYFSSKDEIIQEAVQLATRSTEPIDPELIDHEDVDTLIEVVYGAGVERFSMPERRTKVGLRMRSWSEALENEDVREQVLARWAKYAPVDRRIWEKAREQGLLGDDLDPKAITHVLQAIHDGLDLRWALDPEIDVQACQDVVMSIVQGRFIRKEEKDQ